ncbi:MAG: hypothetical protein H6765_03770 [Candidatus Peribacteria bacterium]|nr:MAG: hypothetical protein H6765_03770 [Candidatus Peribacteria bacterium]
MALGTYELSPMEFTQMWTMFLRPKILGEKYEETIVMVRDILSESTWRILSFGQDSVLNLP